MALADIGRALTGQALDTAKNSMLDAIAGEPPTEPEPQTTTNHDDEPDNWPRPAQPHWPAYVARLLDGA